MQLVKVKKENTGCTKSDKDNVAFRSATKQTNGILSPLCKYRRNKIQVDKESSHNKLDCGQPPWVWPFPADEL